MRFPNAYKGVSKILLSQILQIVGVAITLISAMVAASALSSGSLEAVGIAGIAALCGGVVAIIAYIINILGLVNGVKDETNFKYALIITLIALVLSIVASVIGGMQPWIANWMRFASNILDFAAFQYVCIACMNLAGKLGDQDLLAFGSKFRVLISILFFVMLFANVWERRFDASSASVVQIIANVLEIVVLVLYIILLSKAKKMLAKS